MLSFCIWFSSEKSSNSSNPRGDLLLDSIQTPYSSTSAFGQILWSHLDRSWCLPGWGWVDSEKKTHEVIILLMEDIRRTSWYGETTIYTCQVVQVLQDFFRQHYDYDIHMSSEKYEIWKGKGSSSNHLFAEATVSFRESINMIYVGPC